MKRYVFNLPHSAVPAFISTVAGIMGFNPTRDVTRCCHSFGGAFDIEANGDMCFADTVGDPSIQRLIDKIAERGYYGMKAEDFVRQRNEEDERRTMVQENVFTISMDITSFSEQALDNLRKIMDAKGDLISKALCLEHADFTISNGAVHFPWVTDRLSVEERFYTEQFVWKLCEFCIQSKRINAKPRQVENERFAMRTFCNRIGMTGEEYKGARRMLMQNLDGDAAWKNGRP